MNVAQLIEELQRLPQHYPVVCDVRKSVDESIVGVYAGGTMSSRVGPSVVICTVSDPKNDQDQRYD